LEEARVARITTAELYQAVLGGFGGATSPLPSDASALCIFSWFKGNIARLPEFVKGAMDFGALSCAKSIQDAREVGLLPFCWFEEPGRL
jgi:hypothetical protein